MIGVLMAMDFDSRGLKVAKENKTTVKEELLKLIDIDNPMRMSKIGLNLLNSFSYGGFKRMREDWGAINMPDNQATFLQWYSKICIPKYFPESLVGTTES
jgi:hypothetical protein